MGHVLINKQSFDISVRLGEGKSRESAERRAAVTGLIHHSKESEASRRVPA